MSSVDILAIRKALGRDTWGPPLAFGPDGWRMSGSDAASSVIVTVAWHDVAEFIHASIARADHLPSYGDLVELHQAVWRGKGWAYQVFAPSAEHVNIHPHALHLWGRLDGKPVLPEFAGVINGMRSI